ncbi:hypothetical protein AGMMS49965_12650 [Bacteroidia bacterium]|nr:hypothetical protein AGMMS49965_12650 [Bacteroidia bacterium]
MVVIFPAVGFAQAEYPVSPIFMPLIFDGKFAFPLETPLPADTFSLTMAKKMDGLTVDSIPTNESRSDLAGLQSPPVETFLQRSDWQKKAQHAALWTNNLAAARYDMSDLPGYVEEEKPLEASPLRNIFTVEHELDKHTVDAHFVPKRRYWVTSGSSMLQFSQNYLSTNWYNGGVGNLNMQSVQNFTANYKKNKLSLNNFIEWKLSLYTNPNDTVHGTRFGEDLVRYYGDFGLAASSHWSYSTNLEIKTRLFRAYNENSSVWTGSLFSPLNINMGILGMKYYYEKKYPKDKYKKTTVSADISPLAVQYTYVADDEVDPARYGIEQGEHYLVNFGSSLNANVVINFNRQITFTSRLKYFTNYGQVLVESENTLNMSLNRFLSTRFHLYVRFDDSPGRPRDPDWHYLQVNEICSFGFNYKF